MALGSDCKGSLSLTLPGVYSFTHLLCQIIYLQTLPRFNKVVSQRWALDEYDRGIRGERNVDRGSLTAKETIEAEDVSFPSHSAKKFTCIAKEASEFNFHSDSDSEEGEDDATKVNSTLMLLQTSMTTAIALLK